MKNTTLSFLEGKTSLLKPVNSNTYTLNISGISSEKPVIIFEDRPERRSNVWTVDQYINHLNAGDNEGRKNLILKYYSVEKNSEIELAFTVESATKKEDKNSIELVLNTSSSQKDFNAEHINHKDIIEHVGTQPQLYAGSGINSDSEVSKELLTLLRSSEITVQRNEDMSLTIIMGKPDTETLAFSSGQDAEVRNIETSILSQEWTDLFSESSPNALLSYQLENSTESQQIVFSMDQPTYNKVDNTFEFTAKQSDEQQLINDGTALDYDNITGFGLLDNASKITAEFDNGTLFIDDIISTTGSHYGTYISVKVHNNTQEELTTLFSTKGLAGFDDPLQENIASNASTETIYGVDQGWPGPGHRFSVGAYAYRNTGIAKEIIKPFWVTLYTGFLAYYQWASVDLGSDKMWSEAYNQYYNLSKKYKGSKTLYDDKGDKSRVPVVYNWEIAFEKGIPTKDPLGNPGWNLPANIYITGGEQEPPLM